MNSILIVLTACLAQAHSFSPVVVQEPHEVSDFENYVIDILSSLNSKDFPAVDTMAKLPRHKVFSCITENQEMLYSFCQEYTVLEDDPLITSKQPTEKVCFDIPRVKSDRIGPKPPPLVEAECALIVPGTSDNVTGLVIDDVRYKLMIYGSKLSDEQKFGAVKDLAACMSADFQLPRPLSSYNGSRMNEVMKNWIVPAAWEDRIFLLGGAAGRNEQFYKTIIKNTLCIAKALILNGCSSS